GGPHHVALGPTQAPPNARSAAIRVVLRPASGAFASVAADDLAFGETAPPPTPTPTPMPTVTASPLPTALPTPVPARVATPRRAVASVSSSVATGSSIGSPQSPPSMGATFFAGAAPLGAPGSSTVGAGSHLIRITEALPDSVEPGLDGDFEWVEL